LQHAFKVNKSVLFQAERGLGHKMRFPLLNELPCGEPPRQHAALAASARRDSAASAGPTAARTPGPSKAPQGTDGSDEGCSRNSIGHDLPPDSEREEQC